MEIMLDGSRSVFIDKEAPYVPVEMHLLKV
jgi:hypothetical protein